MQLLRRFKFGVLTLFICFFFNALYADHVNGGQITYEHIFNKKYRFTLKLYRDCNECEFNTSNCANVTKLNVYNGIKDSTTTLKLAEINLTFKSKNDESSFCSTRSSSCNSGSGPSGTEAWVWEGVFDFATLSSDFCDYEIGCIVENRKPIYTANPEFLYVHTYVNTCNGIVNNGVKFISKYIHYLQVNENQTYSLIATDPDGDSLSYHLINAQKGNKTSIAYTNGFKANMPLNVLCNPTCAYNPNIYPTVGFGIDSFTGLVSFTPTMANAQGVLVIAVREWRNIAGEVVLVGQSIRDMVLTTIDQTNYSTKVTPSLQKVYICDTGTFSFDFGINDKAVGTKKDSVSLTVFSQFGNSIVQKIGTTPNIFDALYTYYNANYNHQLDFVTIVSSDNNCPYANINYATIPVYLNKPPIITDTWNNSMCNKLKLGATQINSSNELDNWQLLSLSGSPLDQAMGSSATFTLDGFGKFIVSHGITNTKTGCQYAKNDTINIKPFKLITGITPFPAKLCNQTQLFLKPNIIGGIAPFTITWNNIINSDSIELTMLKDTSFAIKIVDSRNCEYTTTQNILQHPIYSISILDTGYCFNANQKQALNPLIKANLTNFQNTKFSSLAGNSLVVDSNSQWYLLIKETGSNTLELLATDKNGCTYTRTNYINIISPPTMQWLLNTKVCNNINPVDLNKQLNNQITNGTYSSPSLIINEQWLNPINTSGIFPIYFYYNEKGCLVRDTNQIEILSAPVVTIAGDSAIFICKTTTFHTFTASPAGGYWQNTYYNTPEIRPASTTFPDSIFFVKYNYTSIINGCKSSDSVLVTINDPIKFNTPTTPQFCANQTALLNLNVKNHFGPVAIFGSKLLQLRPINNTQFVISTPVTPAKIDTQFLKIVAQANLGCQADSSIVPVIIKPVPIGTISVNNDKGCEPLQVNAQYIPKFNTPIQEYNWYLENNSLGNTSTINVTVNNGFYYLRVKVSHNNCSYEPSPLLINSYKVLPVPEFTMQPSTGLISIDYPYIKFEDITPTAQPYTRLWQLTGPGTLLTSDLKNPVFKYNGTDGLANIMLKITSLDGCSSQSNKKIVVYPSFTIFIPNIFSPNAKGPAENEVFKPIVSKLFDYNFTIANILNNIIFSTNSTDEGWDGNTPNGPAQAGVYYWQITGITPTGNKIIRKGLVTLVR